MATSALAQIRTHSTVQTDWVGRPGDLLHNVAATHDEEGRLHPPPIAAFHSSTLRALITLSLQLLSRRCDLHGI
jgi:hypothetical protein